LASKCCVSGAWPARRSSPSRDHRHGRRAARRARRSHRCVHGCRRSRATTPKLVRSWLRRTLTGALKSIPDSALTLADASAEQEAATTALHLRGESEPTSSDEVGGARDDGTGLLLRGEVLARWQEFGPAPDSFLRQVEAGISRLRDRMAAAVRGTHRRPRDWGGTPVRSCRAPDGPARGLQRVLRRWRQLARGGAVLVTAHPELAEPGQRPRPSQRLVRDWTGRGLSDLVPPEAKDRRTTARVFSFGVNGCWGDPHAPGCSVIPRAQRRRGGIAGVRQFWPSASLRPSSGTRRFETLLPSPGASWWTGPGAVCR